MEGKNKKPPRNDEESDSISKRLINVNQLVRLFGQVSIYLEWRESRLILEGKKSVGGSLKRMNPPFRYVRTTNFPNNHPQ